MAPIAWPLRRSSGTHARRPAAWSPSLIARRAPTRPSPRRRPAARTAVAGCATPRADRGADGTTANRAAVAVRRPRPAPSTPADSAASCPGALAVTVTDDLRVRSATARRGRRRSAYSPAARAGHAARRDRRSRPGVRLRLVSRRAGRASTLDGRRRRTGWVAVADHDGTPVGRRSPTDPTPGYELAVAHRRPRPAAGSPTRRPRPRPRTRFGDRPLQADAQGPDSSSFADKGMVFSPASIATRAGDGPGGRRGDTASRDGPRPAGRGWDSLGAGLNSLDQQLPVRDATLDGRRAGEHTLALRTANTAFAQEGYAIDQAYLERIARDVRVRRRASSTTSTDPEAARDGHQRLGQPPDGAAGSRSSSSRPT